MKKSVFFLLTVCFLFVLVFFVQASEAPYTDEQFFTFSDGVITGYTGNESEVRIPASIGGEPVTTIGQAAFYEKSTLTSVVIPEGITSIGNSAFSGCRSLTEFISPKQLTEIGSSAFSECYALQNVVLPETMSVIQPRTFNFCTSLNDIYLPESITEIKEEAFQGCYALTSITIPKNVQSIGNNAFYYCRNLKEITLPESLKFIDYDVFARCPEFSVIHYNGTREQWNNVRIDHDEYSNYNIYNAAVLCRGETCAAQTNQDLQGFTITPYGAEKDSCVVVLALYKGNRLMQLHSAPYTGKSIYFPVNDENYDAAKVFLWNDFTSLNALCPPQSVYLYYKSRF